MRPGRVRTGVVVAARVGVAAADTNLKNLGVPVLQSVGRDASFTAVADGHGVHIGVILHEPAAAEASGAPFFPSFNVFVKPPKLSFA
jgi:hypothetical protein